jgi:hypothetical protein
MPSYSIADIQSALSEQLYPTITTWNRLEGRPRTTDFDRAMRAEVRDPLWMLSRQWQMGELRGEDAGTPIDARLRTRSTPLASFRAGNGAVQPFDVEVPLEAKVEHKPVPLTMGTVSIALDLRLTAGRRWLEMTNGVGNFRMAFINAFGVQTPTRTAADAPLSAHPESFQLFEAVAGRMVDGGRLYLHLKDGHPATEGLVLSPPLSPTDRAALDALGLPFMTWFESVISVPEASDAWDPSRLEYSFACAAPGEAGERTFEAEGYDGQHLDWYALDAVPGSLGGPVGTPPDAITRALVPTPVTFAGMPDTRYWAFEDRRANFGDVRPDTVDIAKLMLLEFTLVFSNDWFMVPMTLDVGTVTDVLGLVITDSFGDRYWIDRAGRNDPSSTKHFRLFELHRRGEADAGLILLPTVPKVQTSAPREEVMFTRDEMSNMVWAIENTIALPSGEPKSGALAGHETLAYFTQLAGLPAPTPPPPDAPLRYEVMSTVPEHWIPFVPVRITAVPNAREIQLQRGSLPRTLGDSTTKVKPRTALLRQGLDAPLPTPPPPLPTSPAPYFLHEEEIPRAGVVVRQAFQRTRGVDGQTHVWFSASKQTGRGEGSSGLAFDRALPTKS